MDQKELIRSFRSEHRSEQSREAHQEFEKMDLMEQVLFGEISTEEAHRELDLHLDRRL